MKFFLVFFSAACFAQIVYPPNPTKAIGAASTTLTNLNPNLVEGREFFAPQGIALDTSTTPPALYVSDTGNNRVLGWRNAAAFANGQHADIVLGQPDFLTTLPSGPSHSTTPATGLSDPSGITVDSHGNVYVVDSANNRILRFPQPFLQTGTPVPDIAIGQASLTGSGANQGGVSASRLSFSNGTVLAAFLAFDAAGNLWVADAGNNRVLRFNASVLATGTTAASGPAADLVLGQPDFISNSYNPPASPLTSTTAFTTPTGIVFDAAGRLFVEESITTRRGRILMWTPPFSSGQAASRLLGVDTATPAPPAASESSIQTTAASWFSLL
jgi:sugar lactone lactonase YvrE